MAQVPNRQNRTERQGHHGQGHATGRRSGRDNPMNASLMILEIAVLALGMAVLLIDLWTPADRKRFLGYGAAAALGVILIYSFVKFGGTDTHTAFGGIYVFDS